MWPQNTVIGMPEFQASHPSLLFSATYALNSGECCLRFDISDPLLVEDQQKPNRSFT